MVDTALSLDADVQRRPSSLVRLYARYQSIFEMRKGFWWRGWRNMQPYYPLPLAEGHVTRGELWANWNRLSLFMASSRC